MGYARAHLHAGDLCGQLDSHKAEHERDRLLEVDQVSHCDREDLVQAAQADDGGDVGRVHDKWVVAHGEHGRDGIDCKDDIAECDADERRREQSELDPAIRAFDEKLLALKRCRERELLEQIGDDLRHLLLLIVVAVAQEELVRREE